MFFRSGKLCMHAYTLIKSLKMVHKLAHVLQVDQHPKSPHTKPHFFWKYSNLVQSSLPCLQKVRWLLKIWGGIHVLIIPEAITVVGNDDMPMSIINNPTLQLSDENLSIRKNFSFQEDYICCQGHLLPVTSSIFINIAFNNPLFDMYKFFYWEIVAL